MVLEEVWQPGRWVLQYYKSEEVKKCRMGLAVGKDDKSVLLKVVIEQNEDGCEVTWLSVTSSMAHDI